MCCFVSHRTAFLLPSPMDTQFFGRLRIYLEFQRMQTTACSVLLPAGKGKSISQCKNHSITIDAESLAKTRNDFRTPEIWVISASIFEEPYLVVLVWRCTTWISEGKKGSERLRKYSVVTLHWKFSDVCYGITLEFLGECPCLLEELLKVGLAVQDTIHGRVAANL